VYAWKQFALLEMVVYSCSYEEIGAILMLVSGNLGKQGGVVSADRELPLHSSPGRYAGHFGLKSGSRPG
jgi:hypothetical protein